VTSLTERWTYVYVTLPIPERGITRRVINEGGPSYITVAVSATLNFAAPDSTTYLVYRYDASGRVLSITPQLTVPNP
jgi:hypothetical protein